MKIGVKIFENITLLFLFKKYRCVLVDPVVVENIEEVADQPYESLHD